MAAEFSDAPDAGSGVQAAMSGLGRRLLQRAAAPGVIRPVLATRIQRRSFAGGAGLGAEIWRRWSPAAPTPWGYGSGLPYFGFGGPGAAVGTGSGISGPALAARPMRAVTVARTVGAEAVRPAAQVLSGLGSSVQRRHLGGRGGRLIQRKPAAPPPTSTVASGQPPGSSAPLLPSGAQIGPAIVRRGASHLASGSPVSSTAASSSSLPELPQQRPAEPAAGAPVDPVGGPPTVTAPARSLQRIVETRPAIAHRVAGGGPVQRASLTLASSGQIQVQRLALPGPEMAGAPFERSAGAASPSPRPISPAVQPLPIQTVSIRPLIAAGGGPGATLPLIQAARPLLSPRAESIQLRRTAGAPVQRTTAAAPMAELALAPVGVIQRNNKSDPEVDAVRNPAAAALYGTAEALRGPAPAERPSTMTAVLGMATDAVHADAAEKLVEDVVERVMRRLKRSLAVESERHGGRRWP